MLLQHPENAADVSATRRTSESITLVLSQLNNGEPHAFDHLIPLVYRELHRIAHGYLRRESPDHTLQPTALIHEAYLRLAEHGEACYQNRKHFFVVAAQVMRHILVDHARARHTAKRGAGVTVMMEPGDDVAEQRDKAVMRLDDALTGLANEDALKARIVEMRFFGGMTAQEIADCVALPVYVVRRELRNAQIWLRREIEA